MTRQNPLLAPALAFAAGICVWHGIAWGLVPILLVLRLDRPRSLASWIVTASMIPAGAISAALHAPGPPPVIDFEPGEVLLFTGCVVAPPAFFEDRESFTVELEPGARATVNVYLRPGQPPPRLHYGERVEFEARIRKPRNFQNPGAFDYASHLARRSVFWNLSVPARSPIRRLPGTCGSPITAALIRLRTAGLDRLDSLFAGQRLAAGMSRALLLGDDSRLERIWAEDFRRTGTYHALVVSGLHLTTLAACLLFPLRVLSFGPAASLALTAAAAWAYAVMVGGDPPVTRAAAGLTLYLVARCFFRRPRLLNVLAATALAFLLADPGQLFEASFHLSFLAVAMIGAFAIPLLDRVSTPCSTALRALSNGNGDARRDPKQAAFRVEMRLLAETLHFATRLPYRACLAGIAAAGRLWFFAFDLFAVSAVIQAGMVLPMVVYFHRISLSGLSANLIVVPLTSAAVPLGFLAILTAWPPLASIASWLLTAAHSTARWHAALESGWRVPSPPAWLAWMFLTALVLAGLAVAAAGRRRIAASLAAFALALGAVVAHPFRPQIAAGRIEMTAIDVGQGDSLLIASPQGALMIVDGGGFPSHGRRAKPLLDTGEDVVSPYLWSRSIRQVDVVAATHAHEDHIGGLAALIDNFRPRELWTGITPSGDPAWETLRRHAEARGVRVVARRSGERFAWSGLDCEILSPAGGEPPRSRVHNNDSLVMRLGFGQTSFLLTGDTELGAEQRMAALGLLRPADVLKVAHHGSRTSTTEPFVDAVRPSLAVISNGFENSYRFPHADVVERLERSGARILRTDLHGLVRIESDGSRIVSAAYGLPPTTASSSISKTSVAPPGIVGLPRSP